MREREEYIFVATTVIYNRYSFFFFRQKKKKNLRIDFPTCLPESSELHEKCIRHVRLSYAFEIGGGRK